MTGLETSRWEAGTVGKRNRCNGIQKTKSASRKERILQPFVLSELQSQTD